MIAEGLAVNGCKVYITSRKEEACLATAAELNEIAAGSGGECIGFGSDLSAVEGCEMAAQYVSQREEKLHILINNAGATVRALGGVDASCFVSAHMHCGARLHSGADDSMSTLTLRGNVSWT